jgi:hypothetical protein
LLGPGPRLIKKIYRAAVSQSLRNTALDAWLFSSLCSVTFPSLENLGKWFPCSTLSILGQIKNIPVTFILAEGLWINLLWSRLTSDISASAVEEWSVLMSLAAFREHIVLPTRLPQMRPIFVVLLICYCAACSVSDALSLIDGCVPALREISRDGMF